MNKAMSISEATLEKAHFEILKNIAVEISNEIWKHIDDVDCRKTYDTIGIMAEERNVEQFYIPTVVWMVLAKMFIILHDGCNESNVDEIIDGMEQNKI